ncbi:MAG: hypothetical protein OIN86_13625 [Candidatus Methanoperedens sp.]|nr:hypothetical protein [Candidatus Methanoperedens sp.]CAG0950732.1 hypothetical protein METP1_00183 [Methanosarcinales archaeon]
MPTETGVSSILGIENKANKNQPNGYAGLDAAGLIPSTLGPELSINKNAVNGYAGLDASGFIPMTELSYFSIIPIGVSVAGFIPYMDEAMTYLNLIYVATGHYISFDDSTECFSMVKI